MGWPLAIVCYHRVLPDSDRNGHGRPYFARGTAVSGLNFAAQIRGLTRHFEIVSAQQVLDWLGHEHEFARPSCWITFDDGYRDIIRTVAPILGPAGLAATAFVTTEVVDGHERWLPADRWYAALTRATRQRGVFRTLDGRSFAFDLESDYARFVDGPERRAYLLSSPLEQARILATLDDALGVPEVPTANLYLDWNEISWLAEVGWTIGGHGSSHAILTGVPAEEGARELAACRGALVGHGLRAEVFAYPDGAHDVHLAAEVEKAGWRAAVVLENLTASRASSPFALPRFIPADDPEWVDRVLCHAYASASQV